ncbi:unnamed protein product [Chrysodeixis includens]|uniref:Uncharacterized protein n=1 Tax=Chrysodeixis includens TaxID=689277 RepID=A0A9P0BG71_CHRIL|nr:unnamed protein product [Chrysodeixis includens]
MDDRAQKRKLPPPHQDSSETDTSSDDDGPPAARRCAMEEDLHLQHALLNLEDEDDDEPDPPADEDQEEDIDENEDEDDEDDLRRNLDRQHYRENDSDSEDDLDELDPFSSSENLFGGDEDGEDHAIPPYGDAGEEMRDALSDDNHTSSEEDNPQYWIDKAQGVYRVTDEGAHLISPYLLRALQQSIANITGVRPIGVPVNGTVQEITDMLEGIENPRNEQFIASLRQMGPDSSRFLRGYRCEVIRTNIRRTAERIARMEDNPDGYLTPHERRLRDAGFLQNALPRLRVRGPNWPFD